MPPRAEDTNGSSPAGFHSSSGGLLRLRPMVATHDQRWEKRSHLLKISILVLVVTHPLAENRQTAKAGLNRNGRLPAFRRPLLLPTAVDRRAGSPTRQRERSTASLRSQLCRRAFGRRRQVADFDRRRLRANVAGRWQRAVLYGGQQADGRGSEWRWRVVPARDSQRAI
jgi:hypothetical protein